MLGNLDMGGYKLWNAQGIESYSVGLGNAAARFAIGYPAAQVVGGATASFCGQGLAVGSEGGSAAAVFSNGLVQINNGDLQRKFQFFRAISTIVTY
jgi:hypothetical protein